MKNYLFILILLSENYLFSQNAQKPVGRVDYLYVIAVDADVQYNGHASLYFNSEASLLIHHNAPKKDTNLYYPIRNMYGNVPGDPSGLPILKLHQKKQIWYKYLVNPYSVKEYSILRDTFCQVVWTIIPGVKKEISGIQCEKATGHFRGRDYEAWFAPEIPIQSGPFKFGGLPGLILEARTVDNRAQFLFKGIEFSDKITQKIEMPPGGLDLKKTYSDAFRDFNNFIQGIIKDAAAKGWTVTIDPFERLELTEH